MAESITLIVNSTNKAFVFPTPPEKIQFKGSARHQTYDILNTGPVKIPRGTDVESVTCTGTFFGPMKKGEAIAVKKSYKEPEQCIDDLQRWRDKGSILKLTIGNAGFSRDVIIQSVDGEETGAFGNIKYTVTFVTYRELTVSTTKELGIKHFKPKTKPRTSKPKKTYKVVKGDNLWKIASKKLGKGSRYTEIYKLNKTNIEKTAKKHGKKSSNKGWWIYPGEVLTLPDK